MMLPRERIQSALAYLGIGGISWRRLLSLCSDTSSRTVATFDADTRNSGRTSWESIGG